MAQTHSIRHTPTCTSHWSRSPAIYKSSNASPLVSHYQQRSTQKAAKLNQRSRSPPKLFPSQDYPKIYTCHAVDCLRMFPTWSACVTHMRSAHQLQLLHHTLIPDNKCSLCNQEFHTTQSALKHLIRKCIPSTPALIIQTALLSAQEGTSTPSASLPATAARTLKHYFLPRPPSTVIWT